MKTGSKVLIAVIAVVAVVVIGIYFLISNIDSIVKKGIEKYGSEATGTKVTVASVRIGLREGTGTVSGLSVGNPKGFTTSRAFSLKDVSIDLDTSSITKDPVVIDEIRVSAPKVLYEINNSGKANINIIKDNVSSYAGGGGPSEGEGKKILIRRLIIEDGEVEINIAALPGKPQSASLGRIELTNVGGEGGSTPGEIAAQVIRPLANRAIQAAAQAGATRYLGQEADKLKEGASEKLEGLGEKGGEAVKKLFGK
ncbi:MAG: hypothetical protein P8Y85_00090 [Nitrospirota bacterium]|jgi:hypothetical protein